MNLFNRIVYGIKQKLDKMDNENIIKFNTHHREYDLIK